MSTIYPIIHVCMWSFSYLEINEITHSRKVLIILNTYGGLQLLYVYIDPSRGQKRVIPLEMYNIGHYPDTNNLLSVLSTYLVSLYMYVYIYTWKTSLLT